MYIINDKKEIVETEIKEGKIINLKYDYYLYFNCKKCGKETRRQGGQYKRTFGIDFKEIDLSKDELFYCMVCFSYKKNFELYGVNNIFEKKEIIERIKQKRKEKNKEEFGHSLLVKDNLCFECEICGKIITKSFRSYRKNKLCRSCSIIYYDEENKFDKLIKSLPEDVIFLGKKENYQGIRKNNENIFYLFECKKCGRKFEDHFHSNIPHCTYCVESGSSLKEKEVADYITETLNYVIETGTRKIISPKEIDIFIPSKNFGIEFDGLFWHNNIHVDKFYHLNKTLEAKKKGVDVIHIFEDEWDYKKDIVKSIIANRLNKIENIVYARKCSIKEVNKEEERIFLNENHIQGYVPSLYCFGLFYENKLVSLMSFGKSRFNKNYKWELLRFSNKINYKVIGGASKLFKLFNKSNDNIISYCDLRYFKGTVYEELGLKLKGISKPNFFYIKDGIRYSRIKFQKHKLNKLLKIFDEKLTEEENMYNNGYTRIYDCGNYVFTKE